MVGVVNLLATFVASALIDRIGRKSMVVSGSIFMGVVLTVIAIVGKINTKSTLLTYLIFTYVVGFGMSFGPVIWPYITELLHDKGVNVSVLSNWTMAFSIAQGYPYLAKLMGDSFSFLVFAACCFIATIVCVKTIPDTNGKSDSQIK